MTNCKKEAFSASEWTLSKNPTLESRPSPRTRGSSPPPAPRVRGGWTPTARLLMSTYACPPRTRGLDSSRGTKGGCGGVWGTGRVPQRGARGAAPARIACTAHQGGVILRLRRFHLWLRRVLCSRGQPRHPARGAQPPGPPHVGPAAVQACRGACRSARRTRRSKRMAVVCLVASCLSPHAYTAMRDPQPVHSCRHPNVAAEASATVHAHTDHLISPACGGPRGAAEGSGEPARCPRGEPEGRYPSDLRATRHQGGATRSATRTRLNRHGSPAGSPRGGALQIGDISRIGEVQTYAPSADAGTGTVPPRGA
jgi:hypothetical protein